MTLALILIGTVMGGLISVLLAAGFALTMLKRHAHLLVSFAVGTLLTAALMGMLPEALEAGLPAEQLGGWMLVGLLVFFLLEKSVLWRHGHGGELPHVHDHDPRLKAVVPMVVIGGGMHKLVDGVAIAAAFLVDTSLGFATAAAILLHEIPHALGDFMVLLAAGVSRRGALLLNLSSGMATVAGGGLGYVLLNDARPWLPIVLALAAASFIYIAVSDLMPNLQRQPGIGVGAWQVLMISAGGMAILLGQFIEHAYAH
jgi:zinc and cadmium transporter